MAAPPALADVDDLAKAFRELQRLRFTGSFSVTLRDGRLVWAGAKSAEPARLDGLTVADLLALLRSQELAAELTNRVLTPLANSR